MPKRKRKNRQHTTGTTFKNLQNHLGYLEPLKAEQVEQIHQNSMKILRDAGIKVLSAPLRQHLKSLGCLVDDENFLVRTDADFIMEHIAKAPKAIHPNPPPNPAPPPYRRQSHQFRHGLRPPQCQRPHEGAASFNLSRFPRFDAPSPKPQRHPFPRQSSRSHHRPTRAYAPFGLYVQRLDPHR